MSESGQRKVPPDHPLADDRSIERKKKKVEEVPQAIMDDRMDENQDCDHETQKDMGKGEREPEEKLPKNSETTTQKIPSYRESLMGFNGVAIGSSVMEEDDLLKGDDDFYWKMPEPSEEVNKLMEIYPVVPATQDEFNEWCELWNHSMILTILGKRFNLYWLKEFFKKAWGFSSFELIDLPKNYFLARFTDTKQWRNHYRKVLCEGPWIVGQHCVLVQRWNPYFNPYQNPLGRVATWIRIPDIPMHCYNHHFISRLGDRIGRTLKVDLKTLEDFSTRNARVERGRFARICVELNL
ncbi:uncharacterized protein LOC114728699 [Neltuma alba]|uniref:uncharacterized protein LOC114728699 n=1 Tax=Neltuma alba TaxID=207710 RepID=UPI0010A503C7|nr:uncharacterized protein LOC114728699 [Prosopis alba]